ncbi:hypothetical protein [Candidatus Cyanaurora vandensis]|uniref:hypothetical protein n=1 Tax=Candidatus Cyanaurora vandensis TaxID=2714958 RepID=UPI00258032BC|nr:hypothetical protein [Candidatus Cyanaurora vandensis]
MPATLLIDRQQLSKLSKEVLRPLGLGQYSLYKIEVPSVPEVVYALRTSATKIFFLKVDGEPVSVNEHLDFRVLERVVIDNSAEQFFVPNSAVSR